MSTEIMPKVASNNRAITDVGSFLCYKRPDQTHFQVAIWTEGAPAHGDAPATIDTTVSVSAQELNAAGRQSTPPKDFTAFYHRDNKLRLERLASFGTLEWLWVHQDGSAEHWAGELTAWTGETPMNDAVRAPFQISTSEVFPYVWNARPMVRQKVRWTTKVSSDTEIVAEQTATIILQNLTAGAVITPRILDNYGLTTREIALTDPIEATVGSGAASNTVTITAGDTAGSCILVLEVSASNIAGDFVSTAVNVVSAGL